MSLVRRGRATAFDAWFDPDFGRYRRRPGAKIALRYTGASGGNQWSGAVPRSCGTGASASAAGEPFSLMIAAVVGHSVAYAVAENAVKAVADERNPSAKDGRGNRPHDDANG